PRTPAVRSGGRPLVAAQLPEPQRATRWQIVCLALGLLLVAVLIHGVGLGAVLRAFQRLGWLTPLIVVPYFSAYIADSFGWWWILSRDFTSPVECPALAPPRLFAIRAAGEVVNAITPTAYLGGEPVKAWLLHQHGIPIAPGLASVLVSKTALMLTQGAYVLLGLLIALPEWQPAVPLPLAAAAGILLVILMCLLLIGVQRRGLFGFLLGLSRRWTGRKGMLGAWESDILALDQHLREFYGGSLRNFLICCGFHFLGWVVGSCEVYLILWMLGSPVGFLTALSIDALSSVAKLSAIIVPGSLGIQESGQILIFLGFGLGAPAALTFGLLRRGRELLWVGLGLIVLTRYQALGWLRERRRADGEA
ncbi:MAG TPA: lysylphosphatidylglycerol synthase transmembrane domain-containing protein, partial [Candidatus Acidoferrum sp.]|nr:lysylphosphatidylglycerol synthase transmembrane domain-containing protein [Candidatus Acidoferrum sp.]